MDRAAVRSHQREARWWLWWASAGLVSLLMGLAGASSSRAATVWVEGPACHFEGYYEGGVVPSSVVTEAERRAAGCPSDVDGDPSE